MHNAIKTLSSASILGDLTEHEKKFAPEILFALGDTTLLSNGARRVSVVGSRNVSREGQLRATRLSRELVELGVTVVSGLAKGVDTIAHRTAINSGGRTIAVVGTPLDTVYPKENTDLFDEIVVNHLAISQFANGAITTRRSFPERNRTMALLSDATVIVEASEKSGTQHQAWEAIRLGRQVFLLESVVTKANISWVEKVQNHGAAVLSRATLVSSIENLPRLSSRESLAFYTAF